MGNRGRKGIVFGKSKPKGEMRGRKFINVYFSTNAPKGSKIIQKSKHWAEINNDAINGQASNRQNMLRASLIGSKNYLKSISGKYNVEYRIVDKNGNVRRAFTKNKAYEEAYKKAVKAVKADAQKLLKMTEGGEKSPFMRHAYNSQGKLIKFNIGFKKGGKQQYIQSVGDMRRVYSGVKAVDIRRLVKNYGMSVLPEKVAETGKWWRNVRTIDRKTGRFTYERRLNRELEMRLSAAMTNKAFAKQVKRHMADPLIGTRKRGRKVYESESWKPSWLKKFTHTAWSAKEAIRQNKIAAHFGVATQHGAWAKVSLPQGVEYKLRQVRRDVIRQTEIATVEAQSQLMKELDYIKSWNNLTGNAYTGIVSAAYVTTDRVTVRKIYEQLPGVKGRRATRGKISSGVYKQRIQKTAGKKFGIQHKATRAHVYVGRRFDSPNEYFHIADRGQFEQTSGGYAYKEAISLLNTFNPRMAELSSGNSQKLKGLVAMLKVVSGTPEYIDRLSTASGGSIMMYALQRAEEILHEKIKHIQ